MRAIRILLGEDDPSHQLLLLHALTDNQPGVDVTVRATRDGLLHAAVTERYDCVVLDYNLPPYTAPQIISDLRATMSDIPIVVVSSSTTQSIVIKSLRTGVADFVPKSEAVTGRALLDCVESCIDHSRHEQAERRRVNRRLRSAQRKAETDPLTGVGNRRTATKFLTSSRARQSRRTPTTCIMVDLDHFKSVNDHYGHQVGDLVLRSVAELLQDHTPEHDPIIRWGGEEFVVLLSSHTTSQGWVWAEHCRLAIERLAIRAGSSTIHVTASFGVATTATSELDIQVIELADKALYGAKNYGRNRVMTWEMVNAIEQASAITQREQMDIHSRVRLLTKSLSAVIGTTHREHVYAHGKDVQRRAIELGCLIWDDLAVLSELSVAAMYHDLGKLIVPDDLLSKPAPLTSVEKALVELHTEIGCLLLKELGVPERIVEIVRGHHVRYDSRGDTGDPDPIHADTLDMQQRVLTVADAVSVMMSDRPYARQKTPRQVQHELRAHRGSQFDPTVVDLAIHTMDTCKAVA